MNDWPTLLQIALRIGGLSFVAVGGGNALIPALHEQAVLTMHWLTDRAFTESVVLAAIAPGPNMLLLPLIGWRTAGIPGAIVALVAFLVPSATIAVLGARLLVRHEANVAVIALRWALRPVTAGLMLASAAILVGTAARSWPVPGAISSTGLAIGAVAVALASMRFKANALVWLAGAAIVGALV